MTEIVAWRYRYKDALTWVHSTTEPARHPNLIVEPLCVATKPSAAPALLEACRKLVEWHGVRDNNENLLNPEFQEPEIRLAMMAISKAEDPHDLPF